MASRTNLPNPPVQPQQQPQGGPRKYDGKSGPKYDEQFGGHYGACQKIALSGDAPNPEIFAGAWANVSQGLTGQGQDILNVYWQNQVTKLESEQHDFKMHQLPLARIKKVMKADPEVKMISAEAPILFAKGCDIFITELTMRAWIHAEENKRRTLQRSDIASALAKSDMFDFLIDIVPRDEVQQGGKKGGHHGNAAHQAATAAQMGAHGATVQGATLAHHPSMAPAEYPMEPHLQPTAQYMPVQQVPQQVPHLQQQQDAGAGAYTGHPPEMGQQFMYTNYQMPPQ